MSEPVKIAEDLKDAYGHAVAARSGFVITLIERVSAAEAALALAKQQREDDELAFNHANELVGKLEADLARLKAPVSNEEINNFAKVISIPTWMRGAFTDCLNALIAARSTAPDGAQEAEGARDE